ncbi:hypothetical protein CW304_12500 [Bacillus sp. UFRGS-B20]|nr:hypothetical protein CW304_12500 [Bacillus sp. UFRGS-B20]
MTKIGWYFLCFKGRKYYLSRFHQKICDLIARDLLNSAALNIRSYRYVKRLKSKHNLQFFAISEVLSILLKDLKKASARNNADLCSH